MEKDKTLAVKFFTNIATNGCKPHLRFYSLLMLLFLLSSMHYANAQQLVQIKTYDQQLQVMKNVGISVNKKDFISTNDKGEAFFEIAESELPIRTIDIKNDQFETASWNHSKGILEIVVRKKNYRMVRLVLRDANNKPISNLSLTYNGKKKTSVTTDSEGKIEIPLALDEKISSADQFEISGYKIDKLQISERESMVIASRVDPLIAQKLEATSAKTGNQTRNFSEKEYFQNFDLAKLDSIQSLTVFYAVFKNYQIKELDEKIRKRIDAKFNTLVSQLRDSLEQQGNSIVGRISDSSFVQDDIKNLMRAATDENLTLNENRTSFDEKIALITEKLEKGLANLDPATRNSLLADLLALEQLLATNESLFYKNLTDYREILNALKEKYFDIESLESKLSESEAKRLEEQRIFRQRLIGISLLVATFAILIILLISFSSRLRKQKQELVVANGEVKRINENLEGIVTERTKLLAEANRELDTFLYRASHDLRSPVSSIIGLCNIALHLSDGETKELVKKVANTTEGMDKLLKKLSIISEINQPTNYSKISLLDIVEDVQFKFANTIKNTGITFSSDCPGDLTFHSYPNLVGVVINNLIENALFYSVMRDPLNARVEFKSTIVNDQLEFSVYDNGIGIDSHLQDLVFDMFFKGHADAKGNGLGLYIVQKSVQALKGSITLESEPGNFTLVTVTLPLSIIPVTENLEEAMA